MTIAYNLPMTPFKQKLEPFISSYINPLFQQTWTLFAPTPANTKNNLQVKIYFEEEGLEKVSDWISITDIFNKQARKSYSHPYHNFSGTLIQMEALTLGPAISLENETIESPEFPNNMFNEYPYLETLYQFANVIVKQKYENAHSIQLRYSIEYFPEYGTKERLRNMNILTFQLLN